VARSIRRLKKPIMEISLSLFVSPLALP